jgi:phosphofructokinase-like protein
VRSHTIKRIGLLTGGGDCPGLNAVIRSVTKTAMNDHNIEVLGVEDGYLGLITNRLRLLTNADVSGILNVGGTILGTSSRDDPFHYIEHKNGPKVIGDVSDTVVRNYRERKLDALICIGGDGTLAIAHRLSKKRLNIIGIPKTIDNDLCETDYTFGFNTAVSVAMDAIDRLHTTASSHHRVMVIEVMGRYAGWLALESGVAGGGDIILIPEIPYDLQHVCKTVRKRSEYGKRFSIVVVAEGAKPKGGGMLFQKESERPEESRLGGIGTVVGRQIEESSGIETRVTVLGHLQRGGSPTAFDRLLATRFGHRAVEILMQRLFGSMVALKGTKIVPVPIEKAIRRLKLVPPGHPLIDAARSVGTCFGE